MSVPPEHSQYVRRVTLPSGRAVEVVYFESGHRLETPDLQHCPDCAGERVHPVRWSEADLSHWEVELRCPDCEWRECGVYDQAVVDRFDAFLDTGMEALAHDLRRLERANMEAEADRLRDALAAGALLPEDF